MLYIPSDLIFKQIWNEGFKSQEWLNFAGSKTVIYSFSSFCGFMSVYTSYKTFWWNGWGGLSLSENPNPVEHGLGLKKG